MSDMLALYADAERIKQITDEKDRIQSIKLWFDKACSIVTDECKIWPFAIHGDNCGKIKYEGKICKTHLLASVKEYGVIPVNVVLKRTCKGQLCFNHKHMVYINRKRRSR